MASSSSTWKPGDPPWSKWKFNEKAGNYYRGRLDASGQWEYEFNSSIEPNDPSQRIVSPSARVQTLNSHGGEEHFASDTRTYGAHSQPAFGAENRYADQEDYEGVEDEDEEGSDNPYSVHQHQQSNRGSSSTGIIGFDSLTHQMGKSSLSGMPQSSDSIGDIRDEDDDETESVRGKGSGVQIFAGSTDKSTLIWARPNEYASSTEPSDPNYKIHASREFKWGRVFKVLWAEPGSQDQFDSVHQVRRFIVIKRMEGHCIVLPIVNYTKLKPMRHSAQKSHSIIFTSNEPPDPQEEEANLLRPIRIVPVNRRQKLDPTARLNYAKIYTIEHNVKVWFIGHIHPDSEQQLVVDYNSIHTLLPDRSKHKSHASKARHKDFGTMDTTTYPAAFSEPRGYPQPPIGHPPYHASYQASPLSPQPFESPEYSNAAEEAPYSGASRKQRSHQPHSHRYGSSSKDIAGSQRNHPSSVSYDPPNYERDPDLYDDG